MLGIATIFGTISFELRAYIRFTTITSDLLDRCMGIALRVWTGFSDWTGICLCN